MSSPDIKPSNEHQQDSNGRSLRRNSESSFELARLSTALNENDGTSMAFGNFETSSSNDPASTSGDMMHEVFKLRSVRLDYPVTTYEASSRARRRIDEHRERMLKEQRDAQRRRSKEPEKKRSTRDSLDSWMNRPATIQNRNGAATAILNSLEQHVSNSNKPTEQILERVESKPVQVIRHIWSILQRGLFRDERTHSTCNGSEDRCRNTCQSEERSIRSEKSISNKETDNMIRRLWTRFSRRHRTQSTTKSRGDVEMNQLMHGEQHAAISERSGHCSSVVIVSPARTKELLAVGLPKKLRLRLKRAEEQRKREAVASDGDISEPESEEDDDDSVRGGCCVFI